MDSSVFNFHNTLDKSATDNFKALAKILDKMTETAQRLLPFFKDEKSAQFADVNEIIESSKTVKKDFLKAAKHSDHQINVLKLELSNQEQKIKEYEKKNEDLNVQIEKYNKALKSSLDQDKELRAQIALLQNGNENIAKIKEQFDERIKEIEAKGMKNIILEEAKRMKDEKIKQQAMRIDKPNEIINIQGGVNQESQKELDSQRKLIENKDAGKLEKQTP